MYYMPVIGWIVSPKRYVEVLTPIRMSVTLFGNRVFADVIKLRWSYTGLGWVLNPMTGVLTRGEKFWYRDRDTEGEHHVKTEAETGMLQLQAKECQGLWANTRSSKRQESILPLKLQVKHGPADTLIFYV